MEKNGYFKVCHLVLVLTLEPSFCILDESLIKCTMLTNLSFQGVISSFHWFFESSMFYVRQSAISVCFPFLCLCSWCNIYEDTDTWRLYLDEISEKQSVCSVVLTKTEQKLWPRTGGRIWEQRGEVAFPAEAEVWEYAWSMFCVPEII